MTTRIYVAAASLVLLSSCSGITLADIGTPGPVPEGSCLVIGFLGGRDRWNDDTKGVRQLALKLRDPESQVYAESFENQRRDVALAFLRDALATPDETIRLVVYGQSFGGASVLKFARRLDALDIPIDLTVQIDSVGRNDALVPANVSSAGNLYQDNGFIIAGEHPIRADDPSRTQILGNWRFDYDEPPGSEISLAGVSWHKRLIRVAHARMDRDPRVWELAEELIRGACEGNDLRQMPTAPGS